MPGSKELIDALSQVFATKIFEIVFMFIIVATVLLLLKIVAEAIAGYIQFRLDKHIAIGSSVEIYGKLGKVKEITVFTITIETECGYIRVPTKSWRASRFITMKNKVTWDKLK